MNAIKYAKNCDMTKLVILSDSLSVLEALEDRSSTNRLVNKIQTLVSKFGKEKCKFYFVKGHVGINGNELADMKAGEASRSNIEPSYHNYPLSAVKNFLHEKAIDIWNETYIDSDKGKLTKEIIYNIEYAHLWWKIRKPNFFTTQIITGQRALAYEDWSQAKDKEHKIAILSNFLESIIKKLIH